MIFRCNANWFTTPAGTLPCGRPASWFHSESRDLACDTCKGRMVKHYDTNYMPIASMPSRPSQPPSNERTSLGMHGAATPPISDERGKP